MLRTATFLGRRVLFNRLANPGKVVPVTVQHPRKLRPGMSTDCDEEPPLVCPPEPSLMDYGPAPGGCWQEQYDKENKEGNKDLALGFASLIFSIICMLKAGWVKGYDFHFFENMD